MKKKYEFTNYIDLLRWRAETHPQKDVFHFLENGETISKSLTYQAIDFQARLIAAELQKQNLINQRVLLIYPPGIEFICAFLGCLYAKVIAVPAYPPEMNRLAHTLQRVQSIIQDSKTNVILTTKELLSMAQALMQQSQNKQLSLLNWITSDDLPESLASEWVFNQPSKDDLAFLQYTSGSTGKPKGVMISHQNLLYNEKMIETAVGFEEHGMIGASWLPLYHDMGLVGYVLHTIYNGGCTYLMSPIDFLKKPIRWLNLFKKYKANTAAAPNFAYDLCASKITKEQKSSLDLSSWNIALNGAEPVNPQTLERFYHAFKSSGLKRSAIFPSYGMAETAVFIAGPAPNQRGKTLLIDKASMNLNQVKLIEKSEKSTQVVSCGQTWLEQEILIVNPQTLEPNNEDQIGEIWIKGPHVAKGYWQQEELSKATFQAFTKNQKGPYLRTGDLGFLNNKQLYITGRIKDLIILRGRNIYPQDIEREVEKLKLSHQEIRPGCGAAFTIDIDNNEQLVIFQEISNQKNPETFPKIIESIIQTIHQHFEIPVKSIVLLKAGSIPKTSSGKIMRSACKHSFETQFKKPKVSVVYHWQAGQQTRESSQSKSRITKPLAIAKWLMNWLAQEFDLEYEMIEPEQPFAHYGLDSVSSVRLTSELSEWLNITLPDTFIYNYQTIQAVSQYLSTGSDSKSEQTQHSSDYNEPIAIIGTACRFPNQVNHPEQLWQLLIDGIDPLVDIPSSRWNLDDYFSKDPQPGKSYAKKGGFLSNISQFDPQFFGISPREAKSMDPQQRLLLEVSWESFECAGIPREKLKNSNTGVFIGMTNQDYSTLNIFSGHKDLINPYSGTGNSNSVASGRISYIFDLNGPSMTIDTACSSSLVSIHQACQSLKLKECDLALAGGVNLILTPESHIYLSQINALSPDGKCASFDINANGYVRSEGCGLVVLKRLSDAIKDGDYIWGIIKGSATNHDGTSNGLTAPSGPAQEKLFKRLLNQSNIEASQVGFIEAHGTGTRLGDPIEMEAIQNVYSKNRQSPLIVGAIKSNIGHTESASGVASLIKVLLALKHKQIPPNLHFSTLNPSIKLNPQVKIADQIVDWEPIKNRWLAAINSFGLSGTNAHILVENYENSPHETLKDQAPLPFILSVHKKELFPLLKQSYINFLEDTSISIQEISYSSLVHKSLHKYRLSYLVDSKEDLINQLKNDSINQITPLKSLPPIVMVFSGQGGQWQGMGQYLYHNEKQFKTTFLECASAFEPYINWSLKEIFLEQKDEHLTKVNFIQPLLFAYQVSLATLLKHWGIEADMVIGHSMGEIAAAHISGALSLEEAAKIVCLRSQALLKHEGEGGMLLVDQPLEQLKNELSDHPDLDIVVFNSHSSHIVAGKIEYLESLEKQLNQASIFNKRLNVSYASHTPSMREVNLALKDQLGQIHSSIPEIQMFSTVTNQIVAEPLTTEYWLKNLELHVLFADVIRQVSENDLCTYIEISPHPILTTNIKQMSSGKNQLIFGAVLREREEQQYIYSNLLKLFTNGYPIKWDKVFKETLKPIPFVNYHWNLDHFWEDALPTKSDLPRAFFDYYKLSENNSYQWHFTQDTNQKPQLQLKDRANKDILYMNISQPSTSTSNPIKNEHSSVSGLFKAHWIEKKLSLEKPNPHAKGNWIIFNNNEEISSILTMLLQSRNKIVNQVYKGETFEVRDATNYQINPNLSNDFLQLFNLLIQQDQPCSGIIYLWGNSIYKKGEIKPSLQECKHFLNFIQALLIHTNRTCRLYIVTNGTQSKENPIINTSNSPIWGITRALRDSDYSLKTTLIDLSYDTKAVEVQTLFSEIDKNTIETEIVLRQSLRFVRRLLTYTPDLNSEKPEMPVNPVKSDSIFNKFKNYLKTPAIQQKINSYNSYLVVNGNSPSGLFLANQLIIKGANTLLFLEPQNTSLMPELEALKNEGVHIYFIRGNLNSPQIIQDTLREVKSKMPPLGGVFYLSSTPTQYHSSTQKMENFASDLDKHIQLIWSLHINTEKLGIQFFTIISFQSNELDPDPLILSSAFNAFLESFTYFRRIRSLPSQLLSIQENYPSNKALNFKQILEKHRPQLFDDKSPVVTLSHLDFKSLNSPLNMNLFQLARDLDIQWLPETQQTDLPESTLYKEEKTDESEISKPNNLTLESIETTLINEIATILQIKPAKIEKQTNLREYGFDSLMALELKAKLEKHFQKELPTEQLARELTINAIATFICKGHHDG